MARYVLKQWMLCRSVLTTLDTLNLAKNFSLKRVCAAWILPISMSMSCAGVLLVTALFLLGT